MTVLVSEKFDAGTLGSFSSSVGGDNAIAHSTDITHSDSGGATLGSARLEWRDDSATGGSGPAGTCYIYRDFNMLSATHLYVEFYLYFKDFLSSQLRKGAFGAGVANDFFRLSDATPYTQHLAELLIYPAQDSASIPKTGFSGAGKWSRAAAFEAGHFSDYDIEDGTWHRFWIHYYHAVAGYIEWGLDHQILAKTDTFNISANNRPGRIYIGCITNSTGYPAPGSFCYVDDVTIATASSDIVPDLVNQPLLVRASH